jgi:hypothetical protein
MRSPGLAEELLVVYRGVDHQGRTTRSLLPMMKPSTSPPFGANDTAASHSMGV